MQSEMEKAYDEYFDSQEKANKIPLGYDDWLMLEKRDKAYIAAGVMKQQARLHGVDLHSVIDSHDVILRFNNNWNLGIKFVDGMTKPRLIQALQHAIDTLIESDK